jgi:hypothetical protein
MASEANGTRTISGAVLTGLVPLVLIARDQVQLMKEIDDAVNETVRRHFEGGV